MAGKSGGSAAAPDPYKTASTEAQFNRVDTYGPSGSGTRYGYTDPTTGQFVQGTPPQGSQAAVSTVESDWEKALRESMQPAGASATTNILNQNSGANMPGPAQVGDRGTVAQSMFDRSYSMMAPAIEKANSTLLGNLQARGIPIGATAFNDAYGAQQQQTQDTISRLAMSADAAAGQEQSRQFGLDSAARSSSLSEIMQAMGGAFLPASSTPSGNVQGVNYSGLVNDAYNTNQANQAATMSTLGSLGGALLMKCAVAAKDAKGAVSIHDVAEGLMSLPLHHWAYKPEFAPPGHGTEDHLGPMAGDFQETFGLGDGQNIMVVDAFGVLFAALKSALQRIDILERDHYGVEIH